MLLRRFVICAVTSQKKEKAGGIIVDALTMFARVSAIVQHSADRVKPGDLGFDVTFDRSKGEPSIRLFLRSFLFSFPNHRPSLSFQVRRHMTYCDIFFHISHSRVYLIKIRFDSVFNLFNIARLDVNRNERCVKFLNTDIRIS